MGSAWLTLLPAATETLLVVMCLLVWARLRRLEMSSLCRLTLLAVGVDALAQGWLLWARLGKPAGLAWLLHAGLSFLVVHIVYRLGRLLAGLPEVRQCEGGVVAEVVDQGGGVT